jgi:hypothetical protein
MELRHRRYFPAPPLAPALHLFIAIPDLEVELVDIVLREAGRIP